MAAEPAITIAELIAVAYSGLVKVTNATPIVCNPPIMPLTRAKVFLLIIQILFSMFIILLSLSVRKGVGLIPLVTAAQPVVEVKPPAVVGAEVVRCSAYSAYSHPPVADLLSPTPWRIRRTQ
jgi:hypothetical protein